MASYVQCVNGHFYDADKTSECPYCRMSEERKKQFVIHRDSPGMSEEFEEGKTIAEPTAAWYDNVVLPGEIRKSGSSFGIGAEDGEVTIGFASPLTGRAYVTGWLVGVKGPVTGRDYRIYGGSNKIGSGYNADIVVSEDSSIAIKKHCSVVYDEKGNMFYLVPGEGTLTYLNGKNLLKPEPISMGDRIALGNSEFEFIPFCREGHTWEE